MKARVVIVCAVLLTVASNASGQAKVEAQVGGSNFLGITINSVYEIPIFEKGTEFLVPSMGLGFLAPGWDDPACIIHVGLHYKVDHWGIGAEASHFIANPIWGHIPYSDFVNMMIYPDVNYTFNTKSNWYYKVSLGVWIPYDTWIDYSTNKRHQEYAGDAFPGVGFSMGYRICNGNSKTKKDRKTL